MFSDQLKVLCKNHRESGVAKAAQDFATAIESRIESSGQNPAPLIGEYQAKIMAMVAQCLDCVTCSHEETSSQLAEERRKVRELEDLLAAKSRAEELRAKLAEVSPPAAPEAPKQELA